MFLKISQNSEKNIFMRISFLIKLKVTPTTLLKKRLWRRCFPVNFAKFLRTAFYKEHIRWLRLVFQCPNYAYVSNVTDNQYSLQTNLGKDLLHIVLFPSSAQRILFHHGLVLGLHMIWFSLASLRHMLMNI